MFYKVNLIIFWASFSGGFTRIQRMGGGAGTLSERAIKLVKNRSRGKF